jgi:hypothetical protein
LSFVPFALLVCITLKQWPKLHIFPSDGTVSKTEQPPVCARKSAPFRVNNVERLTS